MASSRHGPSSDSVSFPAKSLEELLQCSVCLEKFDSNRRSPRELQCHHTFCLQCLTSIAGIDECGDRRQNSLRCPICRQEHYLGHDKVQQLRIDHKIVQLMDALSGAVKESDNLSGAIKESSSLCQQHRQQPLNFFCKTCKVPVCRDCTVVSHNQTKGHEVVEISDALKEYSPKLINARDIAKKVSEKLQAKSNMFCKAMEELTKNKANEERQICKAFADYRAQLDQREKALLSQLRRGANSNKDELEAFRNTVDHEVSIFRKLDKQFENARKQQEIGQLFLLTHQMMKWGKSSIGLASDKYERQRYVYEPQKDADFRKDVLQLGSINIKCQLPQQKCATKDVLQLGKVEQKSVLPQQKCVTKDVLQLGKVEQKRLLPQQKCVTKDVLQLGDVEKKDYISKQQPVTKPGSASGLDHDNLKKAPASILFPDDVEMVSDDDEDL